ncbi:MAG: D-alanyl-D-alanine carboxypeptidase [Firmicutes bacterium]|nr:D-alanyl-D-alanine carboxypeptidase [Bacillota bacterium]
MKIKMFVFALMALMAVALPYVQPYQGEAGAASEFYSSGRAAIVIDAESKRVFYAKNADAQLPEASTTKIVTAITVIDNCRNLDARVLVHDKAIGVEGTSIYLERGEVLTVRELLYGLMLRSGNDAATALAYHIAGGIPEFCAMMKATALKAGASEKCSFRNAHGLDEAGHHVSARDLAMITAYALESADFKEIVSTKNVKTGDRPDGKVRFMTNKNRLLNSLDGCIGVKTGFTGDAGRCLVTATERDGFRLISVVFNCGPMFEESEEMLETVYKTFQRAEILEPYSYVSSVDVTNTENAKVKLYTKKGFYYPLTETEFANLNYSYNLPDTLKAPVLADAEVGKLEIYLDKQLLFAADVYTMEEVKASSFKDKVKEILDNWQA